MGATLKWCRTYVDQPKFSKLERMKRLTDNMESIAAGQFLHQETAEYLPAYLDFNHQYGEYLDSLCRVSRLKFSFAFDEEYFNDGLWILRA